MISIRARFLFLHVPKCAGNAIQSVLAPWSEDRIVQTRRHHDGIDGFEVINDALGTRKHSTLADYRAKLAPDVYRSLYKFACVRNPWDRLLSHFLFKQAKRGRRHFDREVFSRFIATRPPIEHYVCTAAAARVAGCSGEAWGGESPFDELDRFVRFEHLDEDFELVRKELDLPCGRVPVRNRGRHDHYAAYYDAGTREQVRHRFAAEIDYFGYRFADA